MAGAPERSRRGAGHPRTRAPPGGGLRASSKVLLMSTDIQSRFAAALLDSGRAVPSGLTSWSGALPVRRFAIYRNNVVTSLVRALAARFPATSKIVGEEFFAAMA